MSNGTRTTQKDVARRAGVSQATVSTVLNGGRALVAAETAARIDAAISELGYRPNRFAQALRTQRAMVVACVVPDLTNPFYPALVVGVQTVAAAADYDVVAINSRGEHALEAAAVTAAAYGRYDGIIGVFFNLRAADFAPAIAVGVAVVRIEARRKGGGSLPVDDIFVDNGSASRAVTDRLLDLGHTRIAMIAGRGGPEQVRTEGYRTALAGRGLAPSIWLDNSFDEAGGRRAARAMIGSGPAPSAVIAANDLMAIGAMHELAASGIRVPDQVSVIGFDDILASRLVTPALTTVALNQQAIGVRAAEILIERISGRRTGAGRAEEMPYDLRFRASIAPLKKQPTMEETP